MLAWRLVSARWAGSAFDGEGARRYGGRWNHPGEPAVYLGSSLALAALEVLVHAEPATLQGSRYSAIPVNVPERLIETLEPDSLPGDWTAELDQQSSRDLGTAWLRSGRGPALRVPSAIIRVEHNLILNPAHPDFARLEIGEAQTFTFDARLAGR